MAIQTARYIILAAMPLIMLQGAGCKKEPPKPSLVKVSLRSQPEGVDVKVISHRNQNFGATPRTREMPPGVYVLEFSKPGYETTWKKISCM
ncbi:MAG: PEGA domain-containing protein, partial [Victivallales bacterium]|nr:PEGA domain-containing protein [Victivallales bacterium]